MGSSQFSASTHRRAWRLSSALADSCKPRAKPSCTKAALSTSLNENAHNFFTDFFSFVHFGLPGWPDWCPSGLIQTRRECLLPLVHLLQRQTCWATVKILDEQKLKDSKETLKKGKLHEVNFNDKICLLKKKNFLFWLLITLLLKCSQLT